MSWSVGFIGTPEKVVEALEKNMADHPPSQSKVEYDDAKPHLVGLVKQNFAAEGSGFRNNLIRLEASGSGASRDGTQVQRQYSMKIEQIWGALV